jgi:hypothetical protein
MFEVLYPLTEPLAAVGGSIEPLLYQTFTLFALFPTKYY